ncbi:hypothetical protein quinque_013600 [Culex quinquefasciatus]
MMTSDWDEIERLASDFQNAQLTTSFQRLSELRRSGHSADCEGPAGGDLHDRWQGVLDAGSFDEEGAGRDVCAGRLH